MITENYIKNIQERMDKIFVLKGKISKEEAKELLMLLNNDYDPIELADRMEVYFIVMKSKYGQREVSRVIGVIRKSMISNISLLLNQDRDPNNLKTFLTEIETTREFGLSTTQKIKFAFDLIRSKFFQHTL